MKPRTMFLIVVVTFYILLKVCSCTSELKLNNTATSSQKSRKTLFSEVWNKIQEMNRTIDANITKLEQLVAAHKEDMKDFEVKFKADMARLHGKILKQNETIRKIDVTICSNIIRLNKKIAQQNKTLYKAKCNTWENIFFHNLVAILRGINVSTRKSFYCSAKSKPIPPTLGNGTFESNDIENWFLEMRNFLCNPTAEYFGNAKYMVESFKSLQYAMDNGEICDSEKLDWYISKDDRKAIKEQVDLFFLAVSRSERHSKKKTERNHPELIAFLFASLILTTFMTHAAMTY